MESAPKETQAAIETKLHEVKARLETKQHKFTKSRTKLQEIAEEKQAEVQSKLEEWKVKRKIEELNRRAERAKNYAASGVIVAIAAVDEAEEAILELIAVIVRRMSPRCRSFGRVASTAQAS